MQPSMGCWYPAVENAFCFGPVAVYPLVEWALCLPRGCWSEPALVQTQMPILHGWVALLPSLHLGAEEQSSPGGGDGVSALLVFRSWHRALCASCLHLLVPEKLRHSTALYQGVTPSEGVCGASWSPSGWHQSTAAPAPPCLGK